MTIHMESKLNWLLRNVPEGLLVDSAWMESHGYSRALRKQYVQAAWLESPVRGVFRRPGGKLSWMQVVSSAQLLLHQPFSVGGRSALEVDGYAHYLRHSLKDLHLYSDEKLPGWLGKLRVGTRFVTHSRTRFLPLIDRLDERLASLAEYRSMPEEEKLPGALRITRLEGYPLILSAPERAILELIDELPASETFHHVDAMMEGLTNLRPKILQALLEQCTSVKVKRLFFYFADRHQHGWLRHLARDTIGMGSGKRMIVKGGKYIAAYQITVPEEMDGIY
ncbi:MAG: type IV toxin-antitoxin system AbiEi family antitoxin [Pseudomonadales bacterium]|nr:type IV toxin-antitoxin system AbiEi family antitoxin [Pseudomonadales bacterium]